VAQLKPVWPDVNAFHHLGTSTIAICPRHP
jgi:hypothetical protein